MRIIILIVAFIFPMGAIACEGCKYVMSEGGAEVCNVRPPINTVEQAWCAVHKYLVVTSCLSAHGFSRKSVDAGDRWQLASEDRNLETKGSCRKNNFEICKLSGEIRFSYTGKTCGT